MEYSQKELIDLIFGVAAGKRIMRIFSFEGAEYE